MSYTVVTGDCVEAMRLMQPDSVDAIVTDPPYGLSFMGKKWDYDVPGVDVWREALRVLKPGGRLLAFSGPRTQHRIASNIEAVGFVLEDAMEYFFSVAGIARELWETLDDPQRAALIKIMSSLLPHGDLFWIFGSGFPKHRSKLKPAYEPICVARKGPVSELNIDDCRISTKGEARSRDDSANTKGGSAPMNLSARKVNVAAEWESGRWPANVILDEEAARLLDEQSGFTESARTMRGDRAGVVTPFGGPDTLRGHEDSGGASRFFYIAKASRAERNHGLEGMPAKRGGSTVDGFTEDRARGQDRNRPVENHHPTVKPVDLMRYLVRLVTQPGGLVLDPFMGSGTTGIAAIEEGRRFVGCEIDPEYAAIARRRIGNAQPSLFGVA